jgi:FAD/FMN-containing dehydrogenase
MTLPFEANRPWRNHGRNLHNVPARRYEPETTAEVQAIIAAARRDGRKVRVVGDSHSWSPLAQTDDYQISTRRMRRILAIGKDPLRITVEPGVTVGETLAAYERAGVCLPMNVDIPTITIGGAVSVGANGFARECGPYSDFVEEVELVTGDGSLRTVHRERDPDLWRAVSCGLGLFGVLTKITLRMEPLFRVRVRYERVDLAQAVDEMPGVLMAHDYAQHFWFPGCPKVVVHLCDRTDAPRTLGPLYHFFKGLRGWLSAGGSHLAAALLLRFPALTPRFTAVAQATLGDGDAVMSHTENMLLGPWINSMAPSQNASVTFPPGPDCRYAQEAFRAVVALVDEEARAGRYPANLALNIRLFRRANAYLHGSPADEGPLLCNIQLTSFDNPLWHAFQLRVMDAWLRIPGSRPHWAKLFQDVPGIAARLREVFGANLEAFRRVYEESGCDPEQMFATPFLKEMILDP